MANYRQFPCTSARITRLLLLGSALTTDALAAADASAVDAEVVAQSEPNSVKALTTDGAALATPSPGAASSANLPASAESESAARADGATTSPRREMTGEASAKGALMATLQPKPNPPALPSSAARSRKTDSGALTYGFDVSGYVQAQLEFHQDSSDQLRQGGGLLNQNRFLIRRGRIRIARDWDWASIAVEFDGNTSKGASARIQKGEASFVYRRSPIAGRPALLQLTAGMFELPFGFEMTDSSKTRWFMERSIISRALFPGEPDVGAKLHGGASFLRYSVALTNGEPLDEKSGYGLQDPNANKDVTVRLGADVQPAARWRITGGLSYNVGKGFHAGTDATKATLTATDSNGDGTPDDFYYSPGEAATPSENFGRWAIGADLQLRLKTSLGASVLYGEVVAAQNLDRGLVIADPTVAPKLNVQEFGGYIGLTQQVTEYFVCGIRGDYYDPNSDFLDDRAGKQVPTSIRVYGLSPMIGFVLPERARLSLQWDIQDNRFARDETGVPTRLKNNAVTARLQVNL